MPHDPFDDDPLTRRPRRERRAPRGRPGTLRWMRELLGRPVAMERRNNQWHVVLVDRRRPAEQVRAEALAQLRDEIALRMAELETHASRHAMRHLVAVHGLLGRKGWEAVAAQPSRTLARAVVQAQMLLGRDGSPRMQAFIDHLRRLQVAAEVREDRGQPDSPDRLHDLDSTQGPDVMELQPQDFTDTDAHWVGTVVPDTPGNGKGRKDR